ncbi:MAG: hypothetical protein AAF591_20460 [Verrucomicrobiota bacterium]
MLRFILTVIVTAAVVTGWIVFNPSNSARQFLDTLGLTEILQENYGSSPGPTSLPKESETTLSPPPAKPLPAQGTNQPVSTLPPAEPKTFTPRGPDYDRLIANLKEENQALELKIKTYEERRQGSNIPSSDRKAIQRQIDANKARIAELEVWKAKAN